MLRPHRLLVLALLAGAWPSAAHDSATVDTHTVGHVQIEVPDVTLIDQRGAPRRLPDLVESKGVVLVEFVFTTCATICPVLSGVFAGVQEHFDATVLDYTLLSISIDPEHDTPAVLGRYAETFGAGERWHFLTGTQRDVDDVLRAFGALYEGNNKMYHRPYVYFRRPGGADWLRIDGLASTADLLAEVMAQSDRPQRRRADRPLSGGGFGPTLVDHRGEAVTGKTFGDGLLLMAFGYTSCPDVCPLTLDAVARALDLLGDRAREIQPVFVTVDPARDTPEVLAAYVAAFHPAIVGLTGGPGAIRAIAEAYAVRFGRVDLEEGDYVMDHTTDMQLVAPDGARLASLPFGQPPEVVARTIRLHLDRYAARGL